MRSFLAPPAEAAKRPFAYIVIDVAEDAQVPRAAEKTDHPREVSGAGACGTCGTHKVEAAAADWTTGRSISTVSASVILEVVIAAVALQGS